MATYYEYQVVTSIPEDDEWEEQELVSGVMTREAAEAELASVVENKWYPEGTIRYIEVHSYTDWERL